jgi:hypothetical protein
VRRLGVGQARQAAARCGRLLCAIGLLLALVLAGCGSGNRTRDVVEKGGAAKTEEELEKLLGKPTRVDDGAALGIMGKVYVYEADDGEVQFPIVLGKVQGRKTLPKTKK